MSREIKFRVFAKGVKKMLYATWEIPEVSENEKC